MAEGHHVLLGWEEDTQTLHSAASRPQCGVQSFHLPTGPEAHHAVHTPWGHACCWAVQGGITAATQGLQPFIHTRTQEHMSPADTTRQDTAGLASPSRDPCEVRTAQAPLGHPMQHKGTILAHHSHRPNPRVRLALAHREGGPGPSPHPNTSGLAWGERACGTGLPGGAHLEAWTQLTENGAKGPDQQPVASPIPQGKAKRC